MVFFPLFSQDGCKPKRKKKKKELEIISETLKYLFKIRQTYNNLVADTKVTKELSKKYPDKAPVLEAKMFESFNKDIANDFFSELDVPFFSTQAP